QWTQNEKDEFCRWLARMTASCGFPFIWVENPVWRKFCAKYLPQAPTISRNTLANRWIPDEVQQYRQQAIEQSKGSLVTIQCDGWTGVNFRHYIGFMVGTDKRQVHPVHVYDASNKPKTAVNLYTVIQDVRQDLEKNWGVQVIAICSDSSGESLKARKLALKDSPELMVPSCYAHQVFVISLLDYATFNVHIGCSCHWQLLSYGKNGFYDIIC
ncbi:hypothetical protein AGABI2DRAFT_76970, partial [Agaricus bisporus var. bisporus H97]|uniref:hypothetical protein n=1 Tax=Agaricus bisporus var. bisporus (strain H97 / ATCC MYA-4626 / FGSC 10389) TaxID=936046 RepID=UPI00029F51CE